MMGDSRVDGEGEAGSLGHGGRCLMGLLSHSWTHGGGRGTLDFGCSPGGAAWLSGAVRGCPRLSGAVAGRSVPFLAPAPSSGLCCARLEERDEQRLPSTQKGPGLPGRPGGPQAPCGGGVSMRRASCLPASGLQPACLGQVRPFLPGLTSSGASVPNCRF